MKKQRSQFFSSLIPSFTGIFIFVFINIAALNAQEDGQWMDLFNGKDFSNFEQLNGNAQYTIEDGVMVGTSVAKTPNSFMATKKNLY